MNAVRVLLDDAGIHTVCQEAMCPNAGECFSHNVATFLIMGDVCTRNCRFCAVVGGHPQALDEGEPERVAQAARRLGLWHVVVTSVTRDDIPDGGAGHFAATIAALRRAVPGVVVEVLAPDFRGDLAALGSVLAATPDIFAHNVETVPRLYPVARHEADYGRSLAVLTTAKRAAPGVVTKSGLMLGLGEALDEVRAVLRDLRAAACDMLTLGQYLQPSQTHLPVVEYISPSVFEELRAEALELGFADVAAGPLVRSSYLAEQGWARMHHNTDGRANGESSR